MGNRTEAPTFEGLLDGTFVLRWGELERKLTAAELPAAYAWAALTMQRCNLVGMLRASMVQRGSDGVEVDPDVAFRDRHVRSRELVERMTSALGKSGLEVIADDLRHAVGRG